MIRAESLRKQFRVYEKEPGLWGAFKSFFHREYRDVSAVDDFSLEIGTGEFVGLLGPNGAGKTTLMKMFTGIIAPSGGELSVLGFEPFDRKIPFRKRIALVMGQKSQLWWDIPAIDSFEMLRRYYELSNSDYHARLNHLSEVLGVASLLKVHVRKLSLGERMKMELMACLLHRPDVIFLDEPTIGLDLVAQKNIRNFLREYQREHETTIVLTSHYMADVQALCERLVLILEGKKRFDGPLTQFEQLLGNEKFVSVEFDSPVDQRADIWRGLRPEWNEEGTQVALYVREEELRSRVAQVLTEFPVSDFHTGKIPIEHVMETLLARPELIEGSGGTLRGT